MALEYAEKLVGIEYRWWNPQKSCCESTGPFYAEQGDEVPVTEIQKGQLCCAGLLNVICRRLGLHIPGAVEKHFYAGGTGMWWDWFEEKSMLQPYKEGGIYPKGSILMRQYKSEEDQGHIAIVYDDERIIHSCSEKGVVIEKPWSDFYEAVIIGFLSI